MTVPVPLTPEESKALREQAIIDFATVCATTMEMAVAGHDITTWIAEQTGNWTGLHAQQAVLIVGMLASGAGLGPDDVTLIAKVLLDN